MTKVTCVIIIINVYRFEDTIFASSDLQSQHYQELVETFPAYNVRSVINTLIT